MIIASSPLLSLYEIWYAQDTSNQGCHSYNSIQTHSEGIFEAAISDVPVDSISSLTEARVDDQAEVPTATKVVRINKLFKVGIMTPPVASLQE